MVATPSARSHASMSASATPPVRRATTIGGTATPRRLACRRNVLRSLALRPRWARPKASSRACVRAVYALSKSRSTPPTSTVEPADADVVV